MMGKPIRFAFTRALIALSVLTLAALSPAQAQETPRTSTPAAVVDELEGAVTAERPGGGPRQLAQDAELANSDTVSTGPGASCQLRLADGTLLSMGESSSVTIMDAAYDPGRPDAASAVCRLGRGVYRCLTGEAAAQSPDRFRLETPLAVIGVRGTELGVVVGQDRLQTGVFSGGPGFVTAPEGGPALRILSGQSVDREAGRPFGRAVRISGQLRSLMGAVPMRLHRDAPFAPPGRIKGKALPPALARLKAAGQGGKDASKSAREAGRRDRGEAGRADKAKAKGKTDLSRPDGKGKQDGKAAAASRTEKQGGKGGSGFQKQDGKVKQPRDLIRDIFGAGGSGVKHDSKGAQRGGMRQEFHPGPGKDKGGRGGGRQ